MVRNWKFEPPTTPQENLRCLSDGILKITERCVNGEWRKGLLIDAVEYDFARIVLLVNVIHGELGMTKKLGTKAKWIGFLDFVLSEADKGGFLAWDYEDNQVWGGMADLCLSGYKVSFSYNSKSDSYVCSATAVLSNTSMPGYTLTSWGKDPYMAARLTLYKHLVIADGDWTVLNGGSGADFG